MAKRKYTRHGDEPVAYECTKKFCKWQGTAEQKVKIKKDGGCYQHSCPNCGNDEFYGLLELPKNDSN